MANANAIFNRVWPTFLGGMNLEDDSKVQEHLRGPTIKHLEIAATIMSACIIAEALSNNQE